MIVWKAFAALLGYLSTGSWVGALIGWILVEIVVWFIRRPPPTPPGGAFSGGAWGGAGVPHNAGRSRPAGPVGRARTAAESRQQVFLETVFQLMGRLAKADGRISEREISHTEAFMHQLGMSAARRREAIALFQQGADSSFDVAHALDRFRRSAGKSPHLTQLLLVYLMDVALADGDFRGPEEELLREIASRLGFSFVALEHLIKMTHGQDHFGSRARKSSRTNSSRGSSDRAGSANPPREPSQNATVAAAYQAIGVSEKDSDANVKRAYRKLVSEFHPDKLIGQGVPADMVQAATERSQEIQLAYNLIKKVRGIS